MTSMNDAMKKEDILNRLQGVGNEPRESIRHKSLKRASVLVPLLLLPSSKSTSTLSASSSGGEDMDHDAEDEKDDDDEDDSIVIPHILLTKRSMNLRSHPGQVAFPGGKQDPEDTNSVLHDHHPDIITALREAHEEVGLDPKSVEPLCRLSALESINSLCVTPIVGLIRNSSSSSSSNDEEEKEEDTNSKVHSSSSEERNHHPNNNKKKKNNNNQNNSTKNSQQQHHNQMFLNRLQLNPTEVDAAFITPLSFFLTEPYEKSNIEFRGESFVMRKYKYESSDCGRTFDITGLTAHLSHQVAEIILLNKLK